MASSVDSLLTLQGKVALVTGASGGIGQSIAICLAKAGASVVLQYQSNRAGAVKVSEEINAFGKANVMQADLLDVDSIKALFENTTEQFGKISVLVNCAADQSVAPLQDMTMQSWSNMQRANVDAVFLLSQLFSKQEFSAEDGGAIVNISSIEGSRPAMGHGHYATSKGALEMLTKASALEFGSKFIRVNAVAPGLIWREGIDEQWPEGVNSWKNAAPLGRLGGTEDIANATLFLASSAASFITGTVVTVDGGMSIQPGW